MPESHEGPSALLPSRWTITLQPDPDTHGWRADLHADAMSQHFDSLPALIAWLARLEPPPSPPRGIR